MRAFNLAFSPLLLAAVAGVVSAQDEATVYDTPVLAEARELQKRSPPAGVYVCDQTNWHGKCAWTKLNEGVCMNFPWDAGTSFGPPQGWQCKIYYGGKCTGAMTDGKLTYPGTPNIGATYNNRLKPASYKCRPCPAGSPCINGNAPAYLEAVSKHGEKMPNGKCKIFQSGDVHEVPC
ncbi:hypothetical protein HRR83_001403 [Exophiala dermatitidis]|uniref:Secreted protein n=2 Tax=Exophiala dermatitidis TaxID=5970 RepID=H6C6H9_EXODN|nr:uncharacterized protein HMPREF1120_07317 [Exophiala dermatitidis NIH/UT8656]KAJ4522899.1 hypothetical protein HRR75_001295 [Exophiala dermatitidis]EHY59325.1 hypothetical protein HMPREF1120_07317 [Exophiala dermatitidis NIH/UT8656]KAJ4526212.1 hypothetical protein HRR74_001407 [Exophiala dermatitidis]KAJ4526844.1 hypothetical protein HRR73_001639 [Exophiala dermatitidis]KAJ4532552.1 hypothetical protein HRR76_007541 [Exophiala dermatitidis]